MAYLNEELADMTRDELIEAGMTETVHLSEEDENFLILTQRFGGTIYRETEVHADDYDVALAAEMLGNGYE